MAEKQQPEKPPLSMKEWAYQRIKANILNSTYPAGTSLAPDELAREFGISRTPIREAFLKLAEEGLITPGRV